MLEMDDICDNTNWIQVIWFLYTYKVSILVLAYVTKKKKKKNSRPKQHS